MRPPTACRECRISKRRCTRRATGETCAPCRRRNTTCDSDNIHRQKRDKSIIAETSQNHGRPEATTAAYLADLSTETFMDLIEVYLERVHDRMHNVLHPPTFRRQLMNNEMPGVLLYAVSAVGSKFSSNLEHRNLEAPLTLKAKHLLQSDLENICLENIQTCLLVSALCAGNGYCTSEGLFIRIGISMAEIMKLEFVAMHDSRVTTRETAKMVCWSLYLANHRYFSGLGVPRSFDVSQLTCDLPVDEATFGSLEPSQMRLEGPRKPGLWAQMMTLAGISGLVLEHLRRIARCEIEPEDLAPTLRRLESQLETWVDALPADAQMSTQNLYRQQRNGFGGLFVALHMTFYHYSTLLYFSFLERREAPSLVCRTSIDRCKYYATSFSGLLHLSRQLEGCLVSCPAVGHMITVSSAVLLHTLLFGESREIKDARQELNANFEALVELQDLWPATSVVIGRLMKFQEACLLSTDSHRLDGWMVRFLVVHSTGLDDRKSSFETADQGTAETSRGLAKTAELRELGRYTDFEILQRQDHSN